MKKKPQHLQTHRQSEKIKSNLDSFAKYSSLSAQMLIIVLAGVLGGIKLDGYLKWKFPLFTLLFSIMSVFLAIYYAIKDFLKK